MLSGIEEYAKQCEFERTAHEIDDKADFSLFIIDGTAYVVALNAKANMFLAGFDPQYREHQPLRLSVEDIGTITEGVKSGLFKATMETI